MKPAAKKLIIVLSNLFLLTFIATLLIPKLLDSDRYRDRIASEIEKTLGGKVRIGDISWGLLKGLWLEVDGFEVTGASAFPLDLKLSRVQAGVSILPLLKKRIMLNRLRLDGPDVQLRLQPGPQEATLKRKPPAVGAKPDALRSHGRPADLRMGRLLSRLGIRTLRKAPGRDRASRPLRPYGRRASSETATSASPRAERAKS